MQIEKQIERNALGGLLAKAQEFYRDPENQKAFKKWKEDHDADHRNI